MSAPDLRYWSHRAEREAVAAVAASDRRIAAIHAELSRLYAAQVIHALGGAARQCHAAVTSPGQAVGRMGKDEPMTPDVTEWLAQSSIEADRFAQATDPQAAAEHQERCLLYTGRAMAAMIERRVAFPAPHTA